MRSEIGADVAIAFDDVSKHYSLSLQKEASDFKTMVLHLPRFVSNARRPFVALDHVNLRVKRGESLGIIGPNGSGKSTTLRVMSGITPPTSGKVTANGRISALLELGSGFHPQISGRENAILNAVLLGLTLAEAREVLPQIIEFSELGDFIDQPMRTYSSGMFFRLGFSVAVHVNPEILLIDEVLAVGDAEFQKKCMDHIHGLRAQGRDAGAGDARHAEPAEVLRPRHPPRAGPASPMRARRSRSCTTTSRASNGCSRSRADEQQELKLAQAALVMMVRLDFDGRCASAGRARCASARSPGPGVAIRRRSRSRTCRSRDGQRRRAVRAAARSPSATDIAATLDELWRVAQARRARTPHAAARVVRRSPCRATRARVPMLTLNTFNYYDPRTKPPDAPDDGVRRSSGPRCASRAIAATTPASRLHAGPFAQFIEKLANGSRGSQYRFERWFAGADRRLRGVRCRAVRREGTESASRRRRLGAVGRRDDPGQRRQRDRSAERCVTAPYSAWGRPRLLDQRLQAGHEPGLAIPLPRDRGHDGRPGDRSAAAHVCSTWRAAPASRRCASPTRGCARRRHRSIGWR